MDNDALIAYCDDSNGIPFAECFSLSGADSPAGATFKPVGEFLIEASNGSETFSSVMGVGGPVGSTPAIPSDQVSHFAFFAPVPEPGSIVLFGTVLAFGLGSIKWKRRKA